MEGKQTLKELYNLEYDNAEEELYPLQEWYNQLIDKTVEELTVFDVLRMLRQDVCVDVAMLKIIELLLQDVFAGDAYDGQALEMLLQVDEVVLMPYATVLKSILLGAKEQCEVHEWSYEGEKEDVEEVLNTLWKKLDGERCVVRRSCSKAV